MGKYRVQGPDGRVYVVEAPDGASQQQILAFAETNIGLAPPTPVAAPKPKANINDTNFLKDTAASVISGVGQLLELPSQVYGLATGDFKTAIGDMAHSVTQYGEDMKSPGLKARAEAAQARIDKADKEGFFSGLGTGISEYLSDPRLLASGVAETIPSLFGTAGAGALVSTGAKKILGRELAEQAAKRAAQTAAAAEAGAVAKIGQTAAERAVQRAAMTGGVGFGAVQQGADVGTDAYVRAMETPDAVWSQNPEFMGRVQAGEDPTQVKEDMALSVARQTAAAAGGVSAVTAGLLPATFEKAVLGKSLSGSGFLSRTGKGFLGEAAQEAGEEGGGRVASNIAMRQINPEQDILEGVGSQAGIAAVLGGVSGAGASAAFGGGAEPTSPLPPEAPPAAPVFIAPVITAPPSEGLISVLGQPGTDVTVDEDGTPTPYTFGGLSDEGHVILVDPKGNQYFTDPASLEGIVSPAPVAAPPTGEAPPVGEVPPVGGAPITSPPVETPPAASPIGISPGPTPPGKAPPVGAAPVEAPPVGTPPTGITPEPPPVGGTPPTDVGVPTGATPPVEVPPAAGTPPVAETPVPSAPPANEPGQQIPPAASDDAFTEEEGELARTPNADLATALRGKNAVGAATYLADNAKSPYLRSLNKNVAAMMKTLQNMGYKFTFNMVSPNTKSADPRLAKTISSFKRQKGVLGQVSTSGMGGIGMSMSDILLRDINYPNANSGANEATATHEFIHAVTAGLIYQYQKGRVDKNSRVGSAVGDLIALQKQAKKYFYDVIDGKITVPQRTKEIIQGLTNTNAFQNEHELLTYGLTDWRMQHLLKQIEVKKVNGFTAFIRAIGKMLGLSEKDTNGLRKLIEITEEVMPVSPAKQKRNASLIRFGETATAPTLPSQEGVETLTTPEDRDVKAESLGLVKKKAGLETIYVEPSGTRIAVMEDSKYAPRQNSITDFVVPEGARGKGEGGRILDKVLSIYAPETISAAASSEPSVRAFYKRGFRPASEPNGSLQDALRIMREDSSVTLVVPLQPEEEPSVGATGIGEEQPRKQASAEWSDKRIKDYLREYGYSMDGSKTKGLAVSMTPDEFLDLTTTDQKHKAEIVKEAGNLDLERLRREPTPIFLSVEETPNGLQVIGHEGRHRMAALKAAGITDAPVVLGFYKGEQRQPQDLVKLYPEDFGQGRNNRKMQFAFNAIPISYDYADKLPGLMSEYGSVQINYQTVGDTQAVTDAAVSEIVNSSREDGDKVISDSAEPIKQINEARLDLQSEGQSVPKFSAKALAKQGQVMPPTSPSVDAISNIGMLGSFTPASALARVNKYFRAMFDNMNDKLAYRNLLMSRPEKLFAEITRMPQESKDKLNQVMEYLRLSATPIKEKPDQFSITTEKLFRDNKYVAPALSKPGDTLKLSKEETAILYQIRDYLDETYTLNAQSILQAVGYNGVYSLEGIQSLPAETAKEISRRDSLLRLYNAIESQRVTSYIPFMRDGDVRVIVKQKTTDANGKEKTELAAFYMLDSNQWLREIVGPNLGRAVPDNAFKKRLAEIKKQYPESQGYTVVDTRLAGNMNEKLQLEDLGTLDKLVSLMNANSGKSIKDYFDSTMAGLIDTGELDEYSKAYAEKLAKGYISEWPDQIREILMKQIASNFMKQSQNIPGYDTNLIDKLFDYNRIVASTISHRRYQPEYSKAKDEMVRNHAPGSSALRYALAWDKSADTPEHVLWRGARAVGFYNAMWGSFSSSMVNAMSMWTVVAPQMYVMSGAAARDMYKNSVKMIGAMSLDKNIGAYINVDKIRGLSPDEREALNWAYKTGTVRAQINPELMGMDVGLLKTKGGKIGEAMKRYFDIGASVVSVTEEMNKVAAFMTAYKYAKEPKALANWKKAFANNERAKAIMEAGSDPRAVAAFMTETTTFIGGQIEKPPILRGAGGVAFQFAQYPLQMAFLMYQNFSKMGPRGKQAGLFTLLTMFSVSGLLFAIPFGDDAINIFEWLTEKITGKKRDFRLETQQMLVDLFGEGPEAQRNAEALLYGPFRSLLGLNIGERIGFSSMLPELNNPITAIPALSGTLGKIEEYKNRKPDQPIGAYTALLSPVMGKGVTDVMKGLVVFPQEGYRTQFGSNIKSPDDITAGEQFARVLGFQSADIARLVRAKRAGEEINTGTADKERNNTRRLGKLMADAIRLEQKGDLAGADKLRAEFEDEIQVISEQFQKDIESGNLANGVKPPSSQALREAVMFDLYPETRINNYGKLKRAAILDARRDLLLSGEEDFPDLMEEEEEEEGGVETAFPE